MFFQYIKTLFKEISLIGSFILNILGFLIDRLNIIPSLIITPKIYLIIIFIGFLIANYRIYSKVANNNEQDKLLFKSFINTLPMTGSIVYLRTHDFGSTIDMDQLNQLYEFRDKGNSPDFFYLNKTLEKHNKILLRKTNEFRDILSQYSFPVKQTTRQLYRIKDDDIVIEDDKYEEIKNRLNTLADDIVKTYNLLIIAAKKSNIYS